MNVLHDLSPGNPPDELNVLIEVPKWSANKYEIDKESGMVMLDRVNYDSRVYPVDYGFVPQTHWHDGDPLDVFVISTHPFVPGVIVPARPVGVMHMIDTGDSDAKILAVPIKDMRWGHVQDLSDIAPHLLKELEDYYNHYKSFVNKETKVNGFEDRAAALKVIEESLTLYKDKSGK